MLSVTFGCSVHQGSSLSFAYACGTAASLFSSWRHWSWPPTTSAEMVCGQCLLVTSPVKQAGWGDNFVTASSCSLIFFWCWNSYIKLMGSSCASTGNIPLLNNCFLGMRQCWCFFCIHTGVTVLHEPGASSSLMCCLLTLPCLLYLSLSAAQWACAAFQLHSPLCSLPSSA